MWGQLALVMQVHPPLGVRQLSKLELGRGVCARGGNANRFRQLQQVTK